MPQMAPILWDLLMILSFIILLSMLSKVYFSLKDQIKDSMKHKTSESQTKNLNWLW